MAITNGLCSLSDVKTAMSIYDSNDDDRLELAITTASRMLEGICNRRFYQDAGVSARVFTALNDDLCFVDDISTTTGLIVKTDPQLTGTFSQTWAATDYQLEPLNNIIDGQSWPTTQIRGVKFLEFPRFENRAGVQVTARWGWAAIPDAVKSAGIIQSVAVFKAAEAPFGAMGLAETGIIRVRAIHPTAAALVAPYRRDPILVA